MSGNLPSTVSQLTSLRILDLGYSGMTATLPATISLLNGLTYVLTPQSRLRTPLLHSVRLLCSKLSLTGCSVGGEVPTVITTLINLQYVHS
jgi:hypothetical protein